MCVQKGKELEKGKGKELQMWTLDQAQKKFRLVQSILQSPSHLCWEWAPTVSSWMEP